MIRALLHYAGDHVTADGAWWILGLNAILLIPAIFAVFFYPMAMLVATGAVLILTIAALGAVRFIRGRQPQP